MSTTRYDRYGRPAGYINPIEGKVEPFEVNTVSSTLQYVRYFTSDNTAGTGAIRRISTNATETVQQVAVGWGVWGREDEMDFYPVNSVFVVDDETHLLSSVEPNNTPVDIPE
jgi:hypothetical protein